MAQYDGGPPPKMEEFKYPSDFIQKCRQEYPDWGDLHRLLEQNLPAAGRLLDDSSCGGISPAKVLRLIDGEKVGELRDHAATIIRRRDLYAEWGRIWDQFANLEPAF